MSAKKSKQKKPITTIRRAIKLRSAPTPTPIPPGAIGQAALAAAALRQLENSARQIEQFVEASQMETLIDRLQSELSRENPAAPPHFRLHRE
jgi:hypothetical protein